VAEQVPPTSAADWWPGKLDHSATSADGTAIGYREFGRGPRVIMLPGFGKLAASLRFEARALASSFTVYLPDRRGRGMSGPRRDGDGLRADVEDLAALLHKTRARNVFAAEAAAAIALEAALSLPHVERLALHNPAVEFDGVSQTAWLPRFESELVAGRRPAAIATFVLGTKTGSDSAVRRIPRFLLDAGLGWLYRTDRRADADAGREPQPDLTPAIRSDALLIREAAGPLDRFAGLTCDVLLLRDAKISTSTLAAYDGLAAVLPGARQAVLDDAGHPTDPAARKAWLGELKAAELRLFFR
jgi:pimeloyl-ACP methyl ester carboxylesterase